MDAHAMEPQGRALLAYIEGDLDATLVIHRDDGVDESMPVSHFFRVPSEFTEVENRAIHLCTGRVLDAGAGTGLHSLVLQQKGLPVTAIDISPLAVAVMSQQGVKDAQAADAFGFQGGPFDTILMMGHGIGMVETIEGLDSTSGVRRVALCIGGEPYFFTRVDDRVAHPLVISCSVIMEKFGCILTARVPAARCRSGLASSSQMILRDSPQLKASKD
jgi:SAM-dependent methyltransferase